MCTPEVEFDIALDCRELTKPKLSALAQIVISLVRHNPQYSYLLLSDTPLPKEYVPAGSQNLHQGKPVPGGLALVRYQYWMKRTVDAHAVRMFYEVDHYALFKMKRAPNVTTIHDVNVLDRVSPYSWAYRMAYRLFLRATLRNADLVIVDSEFTRGRVQAYFGTARPVEVLPVGIDKPHSNVDRPKSVGDGPFVLALGRLSHWKGSARLATLFEKRLSGRGMQLIFAGRCDEREVATRLVVEGVSNRCSDVLWLDFVSDAEREWLLQNAALVCYPAIYDGFGMPPLEAAIRGTPCLMNDIPVLREVTRGHGLYTDYFGDDDKVAEHIWSLANAAEPEDLVTPELRAVSSSYAWDFFFDQLFELLTQSRRPAQLAQSEE